MPMKLMPIKWIRPLALCGLLAAGFLFTLRAAYTYYFTGTIDPSITTNSTWFVNTTSWPVKSFVSKLAVPGGGNDYEAYMVVPVTCPGHTSVALRAADTWGGWVGHIAYRVTISAPYGCGTGYTKKLNVCKDDQWVYTLMDTSIGTDWPAGQTLRAFVRSTGTYAGIHIQLGSNTWHVNDSSLPTGKPGFQIVNSPSLTYSVGLGPLDATPPSVPTGLSTITDNTSIVLNWQASTDDSNGKGMLRYDLYLNSNYIGWTTGTSHQFNGLTPNTTYTLGVIAVDGHFSTSAMATTSAITVPQVSSIDPRRIGIHTLGSYWGSPELGENVDLRSGNLNYTIPVASVKLRGGGDVAFSLTYNSQFWHSASGQQSIASSDTGFGFGWRLLAGAISPVFSSGQTISHYQFTDSTGAQYKLDVESGGVWTSKDGVFLNYDANTHKLWFNNGVYWDMLCISGASEGDAGARYPTRIQNPNGNYLEISYRPQQGGSTANTSSRISAIYGAVAGGVTFNYNADTIPHLTSIIAPSGSGQNRAFAYLYGQNAVSPFTGQTILNNQTVLSTVTQTGPNISSSFSYTTSLELSQATLPYGGQLSWTYSDWTYSTGRRIRGVSQRSLRPSAGAPLGSWTLTHNSNPGGAPMRTSTAIGDPGNIGYKNWTFSNADSYTRGLLTQLDEQRSAGDIVLRRTTYAYAQTSAQMPYVQAANTILNPGTSSQKESRVEQTVNQYGNVTQTKAFDFNSLTTPARTVNCVHETSAAYLSRYLRNLATSCSVTNGSQTLNLGLIYYDTVAPAAISGTATHHDTANYGAGFNIRGNPTVMHSGPAIISTASYNILGETIQATSPSGPQMATTYEQSNNFGAPTRITPNSNTNLREDITYNSWLAPTVVSSPNGSSGSALYDSNGRVTTRWDADGVQTTYSYNDAARQMTETLATRWTRTTMDGLGRPVKVETGDGSGTKSIVDTEYGSCACTPIGKVKRTSLPYAPGGTPLWTTYFYDGLGRTAQVQQPNNSGTSTYAYDGNEITVTDPAGRWKKYRSDAFGNLTKVIEPNPKYGQAGEPQTMETNYTYSLRNKLIQVSMPRWFSTGTVTQLRTFTYDSAWGVLLQSQYHPESGTTTYNYSGAQLSSFTDAKGQQTSYTYDAYGRVTRVSRGAAACDAIDYAYDQEQNDYGRLSWVEWGNSDLGVCPKGKMRESYSYTSMGRITGKTTTLTQKRPEAGGAELAATLSLEYAYNTNGLLTEVRYPSTHDAAGNPAPQTKYGYTYDTMLRPSSATQTYGTITNTHVDQVQYGPAGELLQMRWGGTGLLSLTETRTYDALYQLTSIRTKNYSGVDQMYVEYRHPATNNDGRISSMKDHVTGEEVNYTYDSLGRLASAITVGPEWGLSWNYDGFGNRLQQNVTKGTAPSQSILVDANTNRVQSWTYDSNGNATNIPGTGFIGYDAANRVKTVGGETYEYAPSNKRIWKNNAFTLWGAGGERIGGYTVAVFGGQLRFTAVSGDAYFGGKRLQITDRLGSVRSESGVTRSYYPYGEERTSTPNPGDKFGTYHRDGTGLDYANQRHYSASAGRFSTIDPLLASANVIRPQSFNRYSYVEDDPANAHDPAGLATCAPTMQVLVDRQFFAYVWCQSAGNTLAEGYWRPSNGFGWVPGDPVYDDLVSSSEATVGKQLDQQENANLAAAVADALGVLSSYSFSDDCISWLQNTVGLSISAVRARIAQNQVNVYNGFGELAQDTPHWSLYSGTPLERSVRNNSDFQGSGAAMFQGNPLGLTAASSLSGGPIFFNPSVAAYSFIIPGYRISLAATVLHELVHNMTGLTDSDIQRRMRIPEISESVNITREIEGRCF